MSKVIIPISVELGNSLTQINALKKGVTDLGNQSEKALDSISTNSSSAASSLTPLASAFQNGSTSVLNFTNSLKNIEFGIVPIQKLSAAAEGASIDLKQLGQPINTLGASVPLSLLESKVQQVTQSVQNLKQTLNSTPQNLDNLKTATGSANLAVGNFGRILQDLPFGIIGVANNITPFIESFQRLKATASELGVTMKTALLASLTGPGGVILAVSAITSILSFASVGMTFFSRKTKEASENTDKLKESKKKLQGQIDNVFQSIAKETVEIEGLIGIIKSETETRERKAEAIKKLQDINPQYFSDLSTEKISIDNLNEAYKKYVDSIQSRILVGIKQAQVEAKIKELLKAQGKDADDVGAAFLDLENAFNPLNQAAKTLENLGAEGANAARNLRGINSVKSDKVSKLTFEVNSLLSQINKLSKGIEVKVDTGRQAELKRLIEDQEKELSKITGSYEKNKTQIDQITAKIKLYRDELTRFQGKAPTIDKSINKRLEAEKIIAEALLKVKNEEQQKIGEIELKYAELRKKAKEGGIKDLKALEAAEAAEIQAVRDKFAKERREKQQKSIDREAKNRQDLNKLYSEANVALIKDEFKKREAELEYQLKEELNQNNLNFAKQLIRLEQFLVTRVLLYKKYAGLLSENQDKQEKDQADKDKKASDKKLKEIEKTQELYADLIVEGATAFGKALSEGSSPFAAVFEGLANSLGSYLIDLGKTAVKTSKLITTLTAKIGTPTGIVAGIALIALGNILKSAFKKKAEKGFARGGYIDGPGTDTSDSIPARLSKGEYVIKAKSVRKYGARVMEKINKGQVPMSALARAVDPSRAIVNRSEQQFLESLKTRSRAIVNRSEGIELFSNGGLVTDSSRGTSRAIVNRFEAPEIIPYDKSRALVNRSAVPNMNEVFGREVPYIATTKVSGQDLKIILERADRRYSNAT